MRGDQEGTRHAVGIARASVHACGWETRYARAGSGAPVLLLEPQQDAAVSELFDALSAGHRVIAPARPVRASVAAGPDCGCADGRAPSAQLEPLAWLKDLMDGLGLLEVGLVVTDPTLLQVAVALAVDEPARVTHLVVVEGSAGAEGAGAEGAGAEGATGDGAVDGVATPGAAAGAAASPGTAPAATVGGPGAAGASLRTAPPTTVGGPGQSSRVLWLSHSSLGRSHQVRETISREIRAFLSAQ
jgi:hypothetical protein